jgi:hypothetical protein
MVEDTSIMSNSICKSCANRICRLIIPPDYYWEELGIEIEEEDENDREEQIIEHNYCKVLEMPLDHIVLDCNKYKDDKTVTILENESIFNS